ncbi:MAG TPA: response regulator [Candidatus Fimivivens faecavium]|nr:response regulator [Candidatus Fimivivens faecavium]
MKTVVIADDEPIMRLDLTLMLEELGYETVGEASDGFDAVEVCRRRHPDVVLLDIKMPVFDGLGAAEAIIEEGLAGCVVLITAFFDAKFAERAAQIGVTGYLIKPIDIHRLLPALEVAISQGKRLREARAKTREAETKLEESRLIERAKALLAREEGILESEAYRKLQRLAMDKRCSIASLAETVVKRSSQHETVNRAKHMIMKRDGLSDAAAYRKLTIIAADSGLPLLQAARNLLAEEGAK